MGAHLKHTCAASPKVKSNIAASMGVERAQAHRTLSQLERAAELREDRKRFKEYRKGLLREISKLTVKSLSLPELFGLVSLCLSVHTAVFWFLAKVARVNDDLCVFLFVVEGLLLGAWATLRVVRRSKSLKREKREKEFSKKQQEKKKYKCMSVSSEEELCGLDEDKFVVERLRDPMLDAHENDPLVKFLLGFGRVLTTVLGSPHISVAEIFALAMFCVVLNVCGFFFLRHMLRFRLENVLTLLFIELVAPGLVVLVYRLRAHSRLRKNRKKLRKEFQNRLSALKRTEVSETCNSHTECNSPTTAPNSSNLASRETCYTTSTLSNVPSAPTPTSVSDDSAILIELADAVHQLRETIDEHAGLGKEDVLLRVVSEMRLENSLLRSKLLSMHGLVGETK